MAGYLESVAVASGASDARPDLYDAQADAWEPFEPREEPGCEHVVITTSQPLEDSIEQLYKALSTTTNCTA